MSDPLSVLIIEDEPLIAMMIEDYIDLLGHRVGGLADNVADAVGLVAEGDFDVAILDVNLRDGPCWPVADALRGAGKPFVIASGGHVDPPPGAHDGVPELAKPFTLDGVKMALENLQAAA